MPVTTVRMAVVRRRQLRSSVPTFSHQASIGRHFAQHARSDRPPDGEQYSEQDQEPNAQDFHFFMLPQQCVSPTLKRLVQPRLPSIAY